MALLSSISSYYIGVCSLFAVNYLFQYSPVPLFFGDVYNIALLNIHTPYLLPSFVDFIGFLVILICMSVCLSVHGLVVNKRYPYLPQPHFK